MSVIAVLAGVEGRIVRHPAFLAGVGLCAFTLWANMRSPWPADGYGALGGLAVATLGPSTLLVANFAVRRAHRDGAEDLYAALPTGETSRTLGHILSLAWPLAAAVGATGGSTVLYGVTGVPLARWPSPAELAQGPIAVACAGILGIVLARWCPTIVAAVLALVVLVGFQLGHSSLAPIFNPQITGLGERTIGFNSGSAG